ncbi:MAG: ATP-binding protein [Acidimicrobiia bacterium]|nr:ATP-binding protein [Acidimicrobiia bacterium]
MINRRSASSKTHAAAQAILGMAIGVLVLHPTAMIVAGMDHGTSDEGMWPFIKRAWSSFRPEMLTMTGAFAALGGTIGLTFALNTFAMRKRDRAIGHLTRELARDVGSIIAGGETHEIEFKSTGRWDMRLQKVNKVMELVIAKTLAAFLNHDGGSLLIGVADDGAIVGLELDYATLKHQSRDGFQQFLMTLIKERMGGDVCSLIHPTFASLDGHDVCRVIVEPAHRPVYVKDGGVARYFVRTGSISRKLDVEEAMQHVALRWPRRAAPRLRVRSRAGDGP